MKLSENIYIHSFSPPGRSKKSFYHAVSAVLLESCPSTRLRGLNANGYPISNITKQIDLINTLYQPDSKISYSIRFISNPHPVSFSGGRIDVCLFCMNSASSVVKAKKIIEDQTEQILIQLYSSMPDYIWKAVKSSDHFQKLWRPINWDLADIIEIRRREEMVELESIRPTRSIGFNGTNTVHKKKDGNPVYLVHPFLPHPGQMERLLRMMVLHNSPIVYTAILTPVCFLPEEQQAFIDEITVSEGYQPDLTSNTSRLQSQRAKMISQGLMSQMLRLQDSPFYVSVSLASSSPISKTLAEATGVSVSASIGENPSSMYTEPSFIQMGGYDVIHPSTDTELEVARSNLASLSQTAWGKTVAKEKMKRIRFLMDGHEAVNAFRFPEEPGEGLPGINIHNQRIRSIPLELVPEKIDYSDRNKLLLGVNLYLGVKQEVFLPDKDRLNHMYVVGQTGTGKSTAIKTMILSDINSGKGCALIDPHGDLFEELIGLIPEERLDDVVIFDPSDSEYPVGLNLLEAATSDERYFVIREMQAIMRRLLDDQFGSFSKEIAGPVFYQHMQMNMLLAMSDPEQCGTLVEFYNIFQSKNYWKRWIPLKIEDPDLRFWVENTLTSMDYTTNRTGEVSVGSFVSSKFGDFIFDPRLRMIFGQSKSTIDFQEVMNGGKILLINLAKGLLGESNSRFLGLILMAKFQVEAMKRAKINPAERRNFFLYIDEFQALATENFSVLLSEARKFGIGLVLANQFISQIKDQSIIQSIFGNVGTCLSFRLGRDDANIIEPLFLPYFDRFDLTNLPNWQIATKTNVEGRGLTPFTLQTILPSECSKKEIASQVRGLSRNKYNRPRKEVELMISNSLKPVGNVLD